MSALGIRKDSRLPTRCDTSGHHRGEHQQTCLSKLQLLQVSVSSMQEHCNDTRVSCPGREHPLPGQLAISSAQPSVSMSHHDLARLTGAHRKPPPYKPPPTPPPPQPNAMSPPGFTALRRWSPLSPQLPPALALPGSLTSRQTPTAPPRAGQATQPGARPPTGTSHRSATLRPAKFHPRLSPL